MLKFAVFWFFFFSSMSLWSARSDDFTLGMNTWFLLKAGQSCSVLSVSWIVLPLKKLPSSLSAANRRFRWGMKNPEVHFAFLTRHLAVPEFRNAIMFLSSITWVSCVGWAASLQTSQTNFLCPCRRSRGGRERAHLHKGIISLLLSGASEDFPAHSAHSGPWGFTT